MNDLAFFTIIAKNYAAYARTLMDSVAILHPEARRYVLLVDALNGGDDLDLYFDDKLKIFTPIDMLPYEFAMGLAYSYNITELSTALKPFALRHLLNVGHSRVLYLDPDILVFRSLQTDVLTPLDDASIVVTPHITEPIPLDGRIPTEITLLLAGAYNLGFIGVRECEETRRFLSWWSNRLELLCVNDVSRGLFVDQKWIDLVPGLFPGALVLRHPGLNVAYWNLHSRRIVGGDPAPRLSTGEPVIFFHFSGFDAANPASLSRHQDRIDVCSEPDLASLLARYADALRSNEHAVHRAKSYGYGKLSDGTRVDDVAREVCREARERGILFPDPYDVDAEPSLLDYCNASDPSDPGGVPRFTRYLARLHASRPDLTRAFPDPRGADRDAYTRWLRDSAHQTIDRGFIEAALQPTVSRSRGGPIINLAGYFATESGVGEAGRAHIAAVRSAGCDVHLIDFSAGASLNRAREAVGAGALAEGCVNIVCVNADQVPNFAESAGEGFFRNRFTIGSWYWELPSFPQAWFDRFELFNEIWVGSEYVRAAIGAVAPVPVVRVPPIVAPPPIRDASKERFGFPADAFIFLYFFDYLSVFERKNPLGAVDAFQRAFTQRHNVRLVIKTINSTHDRQNADLLARRCAGDPRIEIRETYLSRDEKNAMIATADCYLSLHRAEGFGLTIAEAMYYGTPVVCTGWSGNVDFANTANAYVISAEIVRLERTYGPYEAGQHWADPNLDEAATAMRRIFEDPADAIRRAARASADIREYYSADFVGAIVRQRLQSVIGELEVEA